MQQLAIIVSLKPGSEQRVAELTAMGPPFDPREVGFDRHTVFTTGREAVFVFEGAEVEWRLDDLVYDFFHPLLQDALESWRDVVEGEPRHAGPAYAWQRDG